MYLLVCWTWKAHFPHRKYSFIPQAENKQVPLKELQSQVIAIAMEHQACKDQNKKALKKILKEKVSVKMNGSLMMMRLIDVHINVSLVFQIPRLNQVA